jgi:hypothetical protein
MEGGGDPGRGVCRALPLFSECRARLLYGLLEFAFAIFVVSLTIFPQTSYLMLAEADFFGWVLTKGAGLSVGIYVIVRAMDNIEQGLPEQARARWSRLFY